MAIERSTWVTGIAVSTFLALISALLLSGMNIICTGSEMTRAILAHIRTSISECEIKNPLPDHVQECIRQYAIRRNIPLTHGVPFAYDTYGELIVLAPSEACRGESAGPYSKGPNRIDECGRGDDIR